jgi:hypothetical protein
MSAEDSGSDLLIQLPKRSRKHTHLTQYGHASRYSHRTVSLAWPGIAEEEVCLIKVVIKILQETFFNMVCNEFLPFMVGQSHDNR